jgi:hypothetical protein
MVGEADDEQCDRLVAQRRAARAAGDFLLADSIRNGLVARGVFVLDTAVDEDSYEDARVVDSRHTTAWAGRGWLRWAPASRPGCCEVWNHRRRSFCGQPVAAISHGPAAVALVCCALVWV